MPIFAELEVCKDAAPRSAAMNMAIDEALFETVRLPSIRFYRWNSPALLFGYFGKFADVADYAGERDLIRRWTGGVIDFSRSDFTPSRSIPPTDADFSPLSSFFYTALTYAPPHSLYSDQQRA